MSGIFYKNRPYAGGGGGAGGASALSDLTDTNISNPANGQVLKYNNGFWENDDESGGTTVVANPQGTASADLEKLQVGNNIYGIPQGTNVVANPAGTASTQLNKLQVGNDIYSIPSGGGGGGSSITYGYINPSDAASDGDVYYLLDSNDKKKGLFLYMNNAWALIEGTPYVVETVLYDNGTEDVPWTVSGGTKNASNISLNVGGGTYTNYAVTDNAIDLTDYNTLHVECRYRSRDYNLDLDISSYTGSKYISFTYLTDTSHNEAAIGITDTKTGAATIRIDSRNGDTAEQLLYYMSLS